MYERRFGSFFSSYMYIKYTSKKLQERRSYEKRVRIKLMKLAEKEFHLSVNLFCQGVKKTNFWNYKIVLRKLYSFILYIFKFVLYV